MMWLISYCGRKIEHIEAESYEDALNYAQCSITVREE